MVRHFMEIRGVGIIDIATMYGIGSVLTSKTIDMVVHLEIWRQGKEYDRLGLTQEYATILDVPVPKLTIPIRRAAIWPSCWRSPRATSAPAPVRLQRGGGTGQPPSRAPRENRRITAPGEGWRGPPPSPNPVGKFPQGISSFPQGAGGRAFKINSFVSQTGNNRSMGGVLKWFTLALIWAAPRSRRAS
jgi:hypothetical protein